MRILVLNGSPKKKSDTFRLTDAFLKGMNKKKENTYAYYMRLRLPGLGWEFRCDETDVQDLFW